MPTPQIEFRGIGKAFGGVVALANVSFTIAPGECHAFVGENGAGKSTLGKILAGIHRPDDGGVFFDGQPQRFRNPADAAAAGVGMVHQELAFCPDLSVAENLFLGRYPRRWGIFVNGGEMNAAARRCLAQVSPQTAAIDVRAPLRQLTTAQEQLVQIAAAISSGARILIFDEPTSSLSEEDARQLFGLIGELKMRGVTIIYVSHRMPEIFTLADRASVLRDGHFVGTLAREQISEDALVQMMIGRALSAATPTIRSIAPGSAPRLRVTNLSSPGRLSNICLDIHPGEIVGLAGLVGAGRSEVARALFGLDRAARGQVTVDGSALRLGSTRAALRAGIGLVPEDRKRQGLVLGLSGRANFSLAALRRFRWLGLLDQRAEARATKYFFNRLRVKSPTLETPVRNLSGGNQQKVVIARWLAMELQVLIVDEPTRGVDVGAKAAIHDLLRDLAASGLAILLISSELPELLTLADRLHVLREGRCVAEFGVADASQEALLRAMTGAA